MEMKSMDDIAELFKGLRFRKSLFRGVNEKDVWKKLDAVQKEYRTVYEMQQVAYEARLQERDEKIASLEKQLSEGPAHE